MHGELETMTGITLMKCLPIFDMPAPTQTTTMSSLSPTIIVAKESSGRSPNMISAGMYCSPRAARKIVLSRRPISTSRATGATISQGATRSYGDESVTITPGSAIPAASEASSSQYRPTSSDVRRVPAVPGTHVYGRSRMVPVRAQNRIPPVIGLILKVSGPQAPATPMASSRVVHRTSFW